MDELLAPFLDRFEGSAINSTSLMVLASVLVPALLGAAAWAWRQPNHTERGAVALAATWNAVGLLAANAVAVQAGWWSFHDAGATIAGVPVMLWIGWILLWGVAGPLSPLRPSATLAAFVVFDLIYMPAMHSVLDLGSNWLFGEALLIALVAWPGLLLAEWTRTGVQLASRVRLQVVMFTVLLLWAIPVLATGIAGQSLTLQVPRWATGAVLFGLGGACLPAVIAVHDFFLNSGSPWPWDSTDRPVRSGPYRYLRSPMQSAGTLILIAMALVYGSPVIALAAVSALLYSRIFCEIEARDLIERFGADWANLAMHQRRWLPSWKPHAAGEAATVWVNYSCGVCAPIASFLSRRRPFGLTIRDAAHHTDSLRRLRYERADGASFDGVAGVGACLEHLNLGWAMIGWLLRVPVLWRLWQLVGDAVGFEPRPVDRRPQRCLKPDVEIIAAAGESQ